MELILKALEKNEAEARKIIFGNRLNEAEAMRLFIEGRQDWCEVQIVDKLKDLINR